VRGEEEGAGRGGLAKRNATGGAEFAIFKTHLQPLSGSSGFFRFWDVDRSRIWGGGGDRSRFFGLMKR